VAFAPPRERLGKVCSLGEIAVVVCERCNGRGRLTEPVTDRGEGALDGFAEGKSDKRPEGDLGGIEGDVALRIGFVAMSLGAFSSLFV
jgi:hypothetical protein